MELQITKTAGVNEAGKKPPKNTTALRQRPGTEETAVGKSSAGKAARSREVREKLLLEADGATVAISAEGIGLVQKAEAEEKAFFREQNEKQMYQEMMENTKEASEAQEEGIGDLARAMEIARRILDGDIVPAQDEKFLMEFHSEMYMRVKSMAKLKEEPEKYDSLLEEEEEDNGKSGAGSSGGVKRASEADGAQTDSEAAASEGSEGKETASG